MFNTDEEFRKAALEIADLHTKKNENYGNSFSKLFDELGETSGLVPLYNKLDRLTNLVRGSKNYFESKEDTLKDLASYALMMLVELRRKQAEAAPTSTLQYNSKDKVIAVDAIKDCGYVYSADNLLAKAKSSHCDVKTPKERY